jgi:hypothetical protein
MMASLSHQLPNHELEVVANKLPFVWQFNHWAGKPIRRTRPQNKEGIIGS